MSEVLQRLEMIKNAIMLEDEGIIDLQVQKLSKLPLDPDAAKITGHLKAGSFESVISLIEDYKNNKTGLVSYDDKEVYGLRLELKIVEAEYEELSIQKISLESLLNDFNCQYYHRCGELIESILSFRAKFQKEHSDADPGDQDKADSFSEAQKDYDEFHKNYEENIEAPVVKLSDADQKELKSAYRQASRLCHPDKVSDEFKNQAGEVFKRLNEAYRAKNLKQVNEILSSLLKNKGFSIFSDTISDAEKLRQRIAIVREKITNVIDEIDGIKADETYQLIDAITDWDVYFENMKSNLSKELIRLKEANTQ